MQQNSIGLIILAAGASSRLGKPKQLLKFKGETLLRRIARESISSVCRSVVVVLGAEIDKSQQELADLDVHIIENHDWVEGMGCSIRTGLDKLLETENTIDGVVLTVCDQPFVTNETINNLIDYFRKTGALIVASAYQETLGVPALFSKEVFPFLRELESSGGAKQVINKFEDKTVCVSFPDGTIDIDTLEDFERLQSEK